MIVTSHPKNTAHVLNPTLATIGPPRNNGKNMTKPSTILFFFIPRFSFDLERRTVSE